jgi:hypothetical protein
MSARGKYSITKRNREQAERERVQNKAARRAQREEERKNRPEPAPGEDPDIAGIVPGPQPPPED